MKLFIKEGVYELNTPGNVPVAILVLECHLSTLKRSPWLVRLFLITH